MRKDIYTDYQKRTIAHILDRFQATPPAKRMLCSDEVGLGKTFVAKGIIWGMAWKRYLEGKDRLDVLYLCPNLEIAAQNKKELGIQSENDEDTELTKLENRSSMLFLQVLREDDKTITVEELKGLYEDATGKEEKYLREQDKTKKIRISVFPVTPDTSIKIQGEGDIREREYIRRMIALLNLFGEDNTKLDSLEEQSHKYTAEFDEFKGKLNGNSLDKKNSFFKKIQKFKDKIEEIANASLKKSFTDFLLEMIEKIEKINRTDRTEYWEILRSIRKEYWGILRSIFAKTTIQLIPYDLVIMDEFQNFTDIIQGANQNVQAKNFLRNQQELMYIALNILNIDNDYKLWLKNQTDGFEDLVNADRNRFKELLVEISQIINSVNDDYKKKLECIDSSEDGQKEAIGIFKKCIGNMLAIKSEGEILNSQEQWKIVKKIMGFKTIEYHNTLLKNPEYYKIVEEYLDSMMIELKNNPDIEKESGFGSRTEDKVFQLKLKRIQEDINHDSINFIYDKLRKRISDKLNCTLNGVRYLDHPFIEIYTWATMRFDKTTDDAEKYRLRMILMNLVIYRDSPSNKNSLIMPVFYLWRYMKDEGIENDEISLNVYRFWYYFCYCENKAQRDEYGIDTTAELVDQIFAQEIGSNTRILMLSATPFKMYMGVDDDAEKSPDVKKKETVDTVCDFLQESGKLSGQLKIYKKALKEYACKKLGIEEVIKQKKDFEILMKKYFTRMERNAVAREMNSFQNDNQITDEECIAKSDEKLVNYVDELRGLVENSSAAVTYAKEMPYALSFMPGSFYSNDNGYKIKKTFLKKYNENKEDIATMISNSEYSLLDKNMFDKYSLFAGDFHGVFNDMLYKILDIENIPENKNNPGVGALLWIPPLAVKKDSLKGSFKEHYGYGKTIVFSAWAMTPRGLAILVSYEVRRRLLYSVFPEIAHENYKEEKIPDKINNIRKEIKEKIKSLAETEKNEQKKRQWKVWYKLIEADITSILAVWAETCIDNRRNPLGIEIDDHIKLIEEYSENGCLEKVLEEYDYMSKRHEEKNLGNSKDAQMNSDFEKETKEFDYIKSSRLKVLFKDGEDVVEDDECCVNSFFARGIGSSSDDDKINAIKNLQKAFNSPFPPFVFATTSMGQEGLNFHAYADKVIHWDIPSNPVDFEQREGRINRRNCYVIRRKLIEKYHENEIDVKKSVADVFDSLFDKVKRVWVDNREEPLIKCGIIPNWLLPYGDKKAPEFASITRIVPYFSADKTIIKYHNNLKILQLYRSVIGQPDPEELLDRLVGRTQEGESDVEKLFLDFSPYNFNNNY